MKNIIEKFVCRVGDFLRRVLLLLVLAGLAACETGPPVQEMSDARQAIAVARQAGAELLAPDDMRAAQSYLDSAQRKLSERSNAQARSDAIQAKNRAIDALENAESVDLDDPQP
ncbi:MAG: DUF4398 domain-containing protein [Proteobacteria bacterium]|nr:DUF4398 domain-containing protein [Pseudomonadota bacterium]